MRSFEKNLPSETEGSRRRSSLEWRQRESSGRGGEPRAE